MRFTKMEGLGNDYVYVDLHEERVDDPAGLSRAISDRYCGVGSDGLILIAPSKSADVRMEMYNADGSRSQMCGNGIRCVARYAVEHGLATGPELTIETDAGIKRAWCRMKNGKIDSVRIDMGKPELEAGSLPATIEEARMIDYPLEVDGITWKATGVSMGNPHVVLFVDDVDAVDLARIGPLFEYAPIFPERVNAHFTRIDAHDRITAITWERGSGATRACGTGACAVAVAAALTNRADRNVTVRLPGGDLHIEWAADDHVYKTGPAVQVFTGDWPTRSPGG